MLRQLYDLSTGTLNPSYKTGLLPGGAGVQTAGTQTVPGISSPSLETFQLEVYDTTAPTLITQGVTLGTPAPAGKLLVLDTANSAFGANWKLNNAKFQPCVAGESGIVVAQGDATQVGTCTSSASGNIASPGAKAQVVVAGPVQAFVQTTVTNTAISAGMPLAADGAGNLTYAGASPAAGTVLAKAADSMAAGISIPALKNVYFGGY